MKKILLLPFLLPLSSFAASFYPMHRIAQTDNKLTVIEKYPALNLVLVSEDGGFPNQTHTIFSVPWGLDRINQRTLPLDGKYGLVGDSSVTAFIVDTGVQPQPDFFPNLELGFDATNSSDTSDCLGHGTHVAGTIGSAKYGVAYGTKIVPVKVFRGCSGSTTTQIILRGLNYVAESTARPAVVNMSLGGPSDTALDTAVTAVTAAGVHVVVAAGNESEDACYTSPARLGKTSDVITAGATTITDEVAYFSNFGPCVNIYAPGNDIESVGRSGGSKKMSGTSMASPHVAGAVALYLAKYPDATPAEAKQYLIDSATPGVLTMNNILFEGTLLFVE